MVDKFLGGSFLTYGTDVIKYSNMNQENRSDPMIEIFPRITKCTFHKYGASGSIQKHGKFMQHTWLFDKLVNSFQYHFRLYVYLSTQYSQ